MKKLLIVFILSGGQLFAQGVKSITKTDIKDVRVYQNGAQVHRNFKTTVEAGITQLSVEGLSSRIDKNSITISGAADVVLLSVIHELNYLSEEKKTPEILRLEDSLEVLKLEQEKTGGLDEIYTEEISLLKANKSVGGANVGVDSDNLREVADFFRTRMIELKVKLIDIHREQKRLNEKITKINQQLAELNAKRSVPTSTIYISVSSKQQSNINFELGYYVSGAGWTPSYDIRAKDINSPIQLSYKASVFQNTGEDWDDVKLTLSTGNPALSGTKPVLNPWYLDFYTPIYQQLYKNQGAQDREDAPQPQLKEVVVSSAMAPPTVTVAENQLSTDFEIQNSYSIPSNSKKYTVDIQSHQLAATYKYFAAPKVDKDAFLLAKVIGWSELNLLPGVATIYFEGSYVGESSINPMNTADTLDLSLGRDKKIIITREKKKELSTSKFVGGNIVKELNESITVRNTKRESIHISIEDQIPISKNGDIKVNAQEYSGGNFNEETGKVIWEIDVAPSMTQIKKLGFTVKYPKDKVVNGL